MHGPRTTAITSGWKQQFLLSVCCGSAMMLLGYDQGVMSGLLTGKAFTEQFPEIDITNNKTGSATLQGTVVAIYDIGCLVGSLLTFFYGEYFGRRRTIIYGCSILIVGAIIQTTSYGIPQIIVGRIITGVGNGMNTSTVPVFHSECIQAAKRGRAIATQLAATIFGVCISYWLDYGMSYSDSAAQFRVPIAFQCAFALVCLVFVQFCPESPRWLLKHGFDDESRDVLDRLSRHTGENRGQLLDAEFNEIKAALAAEIAACPKDKNGNPVSPVRACFTSRDRSFHRVMLGFGCQFMQQWSGINFISYYAPVIFEVSLGMPHKLSLLLSGFNGISYFITSLIPIWILDRVGRRKLLLTSAIGQTFCMAVLAGCTSTSAFAPGIVAVVMLFCFTSFFSVGMLAIPWLLPSEYTPLPIRAPASALGSASNWLWTYVVVTVIPISIDSIGYKTYIYFAVFNAAFVPILYMFYPETVGLTLEESDLLFTGEKVLIHLPPHMRGLRHADENSAAEGGQAPASFDDEKHGPDVEHVDFKS